MSRENCANRPVFLAQNIINLDSLANNVVEIGSFHFNRTLEHQISINGLRVELKDAAQQRAFGNYNTRTGIISLREDIWCKKTIIHEVMHSTSKLSNEGFHLVDLHLLEGLTEFLAGFLLWNYSQDCSSKWQKKTTFCKVTYDEHTRFWYTFFRYVPISAGLKFYFGFNNRRWKRRFDDMLKKIPKRGRKRFKNPRKQTGTLNKNFSHECKRYWGDSFEHIYNIESAKFDFTQIQNDLTTNCLIDNAFS